MLLLWFTFGDQRREGGSGVMEKEDMFPGKKTDYCSMTVVSPRRLVEGGKRALALREKNTVIAKPLS
jgi:hypothetical protein